jgi:hypothetical protein
VTLKYPSSGYGMSAPSKQSALVNKLAASNNAAAGTSSWSLPKTTSFPTLSKVTGATGNTLYPPPKTTSSAYYPGAPAPKSTGSSSSGFPSLSSLYPGASSAGPKPSAWTPPTAAKAPTSNLQMPGGFSSGALPLLSPSALQGAGYTPPAAPRAAAASAPARTGALPSSSAPPPAAAKPNTVVPGQGYGMSSPTTANAINKQAAQTNLNTGNSNNINGGAWLEGVGKKAVDSTGEPYEVKVAYDAYGNPFTYKESASTSANGTRQVAGLSKDGTILRSYTDAQGKVQVYDTRTWPNGKPTTSPVVGRPTQAGQPVSTPVIQPSAPRQPTQDEIDEANQGRWLQ